MKIPTILNVFDQVFERKGKAEAKRGRRWLLRRRPAREINISDRLVRTKLISANSRMQPDKTSGGGGGGTSMKSSATGQQQQSLGPSCHATPPLLGPIFTQ